MSTVPGREKWVKCKGTRLSWVLQLTSTPSPRLPLASPRLEVDSEGANQSEERLFALPLYLIGKVDRVYRYHTSIRLLHKTVTTQQ